MEWLYGVNINNKIMPFDIDPQFAIYRIKQYLKEHEEFIEGILKIDGPTNIYVCSEDRKQITIEDMEQFKNYDIKYIYYKNTLFEWEDLKEYKGFY